MSASDEAAPPEITAGSGRPPRLEVPEPDGDATTVMVPGVRSAARAVLRPLLRAWLRLRVSGEEHVPDGPALLASTHASHADSVAIGCAVTRPVYFLGDVRLTRWPVLGPLLPKLGMVPVRRGQRDAGALQAVSALLGADQAVVVYPEGSRSRDGRIYRPRSGTSRLAASLRVPVVPVAVRGTYEVWPTGRRPRLRGGRVVVRIGPPMAPPADDPGDRRHFNERLHDHLVELSGAPRAESFAPVGGGEEAA